MLYKTKDVVLVPHLPMSAEGSCNTKKDWLAYFGTHKQHIAGKEAVIANTMTFSTLDNERIYLLKQNGHEHWYRECQLQEGQLRQIPLFKEVVE